MVALGARRGSARRPTRSGARCASGSARWRRVGSHRSTRRRSARPVFTGATRPGHVQSVRDPSSTRPYRCARPPIASPPASSLPRLATTSACRPSVCLSSRCARFAEIRTSFARVSHEFRTSFARDSHEIEAGLVPPSDWSPRRVASIHSSRAMFAPAGRPRMPAARLCVPAARVCRPPPPSAAAALAQRRRRDRAEIEPRSS